MLDGEQAIIARAVRGESSAFGLLYDHYEPQIYRFVFIKVSRREEAEDLTHQIFLSAWQSIGRYEDLGFPFSSWLYRIARNEVIDYYRSKREFVPIEDLDPELLAIPSDAARIVDQSLALERALAVIQELKPEHQDVLIMRFIDDMPIKDVALAMGKTEGAVKLLQHRALRQVERRLRP